MDKDPNSQNQPDEHKLRSRFLGSSSGEDAFHSKPSENAPMEKCPSCGNEILVLPSAPLKCGCGWSPQAKKVLVRNLCVALVIAGLCVMAWYFVRHYYEFFPDNKTAEQFMKEANDMQTETQWDEAIALYQRAANISPKRSDIRIKLAKLLTMRKPNAALDEAKAAAELDPNNLDVNKTYIGIIENFGEFKDAEPVFERQLKLYPKDMELHLQAASYFRTVRKMDRAEALYKEATQIQKQGDLSWGNLATLYRESGKRNEAMQVLKDGLSANPNSAVLIYELGYLYATADDVAAIPYLKKAAELNPGLTESVSPLLERVTKKTGKPIHLVQLYRRGNDFLVDTVIDGKYHAWMKVDTGANLCVIPSYIVRSAGANISHTRMVHIVSVTGSATAPLVELSDMSIGGARARNVQAVVYDMPGQGQEGLLGISFLEHFKVYLDTNHQQMILTERTVKAH